MNIHNVLFATCEIAPLQPVSKIIDMTMQLPPAIKTLRRNIYVITPAYPELLNTITNPALCAEIKISGVDTPINLFEGKLPGSSVKLLLAEMPHFSNAINHKDGEADDNNESAVRFCQVVTAIAQGTLRGVGNTPFKWQPQLVHCNGWQTGLVPALLAQHNSQVATLFTLHNPRRQECVALDQLHQWGLFTALKPDARAITDGQLCFTKTALHYADMVNTTSPTYARELCTATLGHGLEKLLAPRQNSFHGILNGINYQKWNPAKDRCLPRSYNSHTLDDKILSKLALQRAFNLPPCENCCLIGIIGNLSSEKGIDLLFEVIPKLLQQNMQIILLGKGEMQYVTQLRQFCLENSEKIAAHAREDSRLARLMIGGADIYLAPSRFATCATRSRLALRYGTVPAVNNSGALADSVTDTNDKSLANTTASGFLLDISSADTLFTTLNRAIELHQQHPKKWKKIAINGMQQDFSWRRAAKQYIDLYKKTIEIRGNSRSQV